MRCCSLTHALLLVSETPVVVIVWAAVRSLFPDAPAPATLTLPPVPLPSSTPPLLLLDAITPHPQTPSESPSIGDDALPLFMCVGLAPHGRCQERIQILPTLLLLLLCNSRFLTSTNSSTSTSTSLAPRSRTPGFLFRSTSPCDPVPQTRAAGYAFQLLLLLLGNNARDLKAANAWSAGCWVDMYRLGRARRRDVSIASRPFRSS